MRPNFLLFLRNEFLLSPNTSSAKFSPDSFPVLLFLSLANYKKFSKFFSLHQFVILKNVSLRDSSKVTRSRMSIKFPENTITSEADRICQRKFA